MSNLLLDSLEIKGFRGFRQLQIDRLGRVNLIVGKNGVGKTALLEALRLYADRGHPRLISLILKERDEHRHIRARRHTNQGEVGIKYLFRGRPDLQGQVEPILIGPVDKPLHMLRIVVVKEEQEGNGQSQRPQSRYELPADSVNIHTDIYLGETRGFRSSFDAEGYRSGGIANSPEFAEIRYNYIPAGGLRAEEVSTLWDTTTLTRGEEDVLAALRIIVPDVKRVNLLGDGTTDEGRFIVVLVEGLDNPIPLRSLGEGMNRLFGLALVLVNSAGGLLLVDEIDTGLHYSVQSAMWRLIFQTARRLNVQVFATTHSWDCIEAFQKAAVEDQQEEGVLIRLEERKKDIVAVPYTEDELRIATRELIEVR